MNFTAIYKSTPCRVHNKPLTSSSNTPYSRPQTPYCIHSARIVKPCKLFTSAGKKEYIGLTLWEKIKLGIARPKNLSKELDSAKNVFDRLSSSKSPVQINKVHEEGYELSGSE